MAAVMENSTNSKIWNDSYSMLTLKNTLDLFTSAIFNWRSSRFHAGMR